MEPEDELARIVRSADPERYLSVLYAPVDKRAALLALYAFDVEVCTIRDRVREPLPGEIRLQWWRDTIATGAAVGHPVADALVTAIHIHGLPNPVFDTMLEARIFDLYDDPMPDRAELETYLSQTEGAIIRLATQLLAPEEAAPLDDAISGHAGCAKGLAKLLLRLASDRGRGRCFLPRDILGAVGSSPESFLSDAPDPARSKAVEAMHALTWEHFRLFAALAAGLPAALRPAFLPLAVLPDMLGRLKDPDRVLAGTVEAVPSWRRHWRMLKRATRGWPGK